MTDSLRIKPKTYYYNEQIRKYLIQFMTIFSELQVSVGKNDYNSESNLIYVPVINGSMDRVVASIKMENTQNKMIKLPIMAANISGIEMAPESRKGVNQQYREVFLPLGGTAPDDFKVVYKLVPIPYFLRYDLHVLVSNRRHQHEILEQILQLFDPDLQFYTSDDVADWTKINKLTLDSIAFEESYPAETEPRMIQFTLSFSSLIYLSAPLNVKENFIKSVKLRLDAIPTDGNTQEIVEDITRESPEYKILFDIEDYDIPET